MSRIASPERRVRPAVERLEDRDVPAHFQFTQVNNVLTIVGGPRRDILRVFDDGLGGITVVSPQDPSRDNFTGINAVNVFMLGGQDVVRYAMPASGLFTSRRVRVVLGPGADTFAGAFNGCDLFANMTMDVRGMAGDDTLTVNAMRGVNTQGGELAVRLYGATVGDQAFNNASDADTLICNHNGRLATDATFVLDGGPGEFSDTVVCNSTLRNGSFGTLRARVFGRAEDDILGLRVFVRQAPQPINLIIDAILDGGPGDMDQCISTPNVLVVNCP